MELVAAGLEVEVGVAFLTGAGAFFLGVGFETPGIDSSSGKSSSLLRDTALGGAGLVLNSGIGGSPTS